MTYAHEASPSGLLSRAEGSELQQRLNQAGDRARYLARVARGLSGALHTECAVDLVLEMLVGPVVDWAQVAMADRRTWTFRARQVGHATRSAALPVHDVDETTTLVNEFIAQRWDYYDICAAHDEQGQTATLLARLKDELAPSLEYGAFIIHSMTTGQPQTVNFFVY